VGVLRPDGRNHLGNRAIGRALIELVRTELVRRDGTQVGGNGDEVARVWVGDTDALLGFLVHPRHEGVETEVEGTANKEFGGAADATAALRLLWLRAPVLLGHDVVDNGVGHLNGISRLMRARSGLK